MPSSNDINDVLARAKMEGASMQQPVDQVARAAQAQQQEARERADLVGASTWKKALHYLKWNQPQVWPFIYAELEKARIEFGLPDLEDSLQFTCAIQTGISLGAGAAQARQQAEQMRLATLSVGICKVLREARNKDRSSYTDVREWAFEPVDHEEAGPESEEGTTGVRTVKRPRLSNAELSVLLSGLKQQHIVRGKNNDEFAVMITGRGVQWLEGIEAQMQSMAEQHEAATKTCFDCEENPPTVMITHDGQPIGLCAGCAKERGVEVPEEDPDDAPPTDEEQPQE